MVPIFYYFIKSLMPKLMRGFHCFFFMKNVFLVGPSFGLSDVRLLGFDSQISIIVKLFLVLYFMDWFEHIFVLNFYFFVTLIIE